MKKLLSFLLCAAVLMGLSMTPALASGEADGDSTPAVSEEMPSVLPEEDTVSAEFSAEAAFVPDEDGGGDVAPTDPEVTSGVFGENDAFSWSVDENNVLTVSGAGAMPSFEGAAPWFDCRGIVKSIVIDKGITTVSENAFNAFAAAEMLFLPEGLLSIGKSAFSFCRALLTVAIPSTVTAIGDYAFSGCESLGLMTLPDGLKTIGNGAFSHNALLALTLPDGLESIGMNAFLSSASLVDLSLPGSLTSIGMGAFNDCAALKTVTVGEGITSLPALCFCDCPALETISLPSTIETLEGGFINVNNSLTAITVASDTENGYEFYCWQDADGYALTNEELVAAPEQSTLTATWLNIWTDSFSDVTPSNWFYDSVKYCYQMGLMEGFSATEFSPGGAGTRAQVVMVLYRLAGSPDVTTASSFTDVAATSWYHDAVEWANSTGIALGYPDGTFSPASAVTRQEFLTFLYRFTDYLGILLNDWDDSYTATFSDAASISDWALDAENWSVAVGLQEGYALSDGGYALLPQSSITRAELATFLARYHCNIDLIAGIEIIEYLEGKPVSELIAYCGEPISKSYEESCLIIGAQDGLWVYDGFNVQTLQYEDGTEIVMSIA